MYDFGLRRGAVFGLQWVVDTFAPTVTLALVYKDLYTASKVKESEGSSNATPSDSIRVAKLLVTDIAVL